MADGAPMSDERPRIALDVHPADQGIAGPRDEEPAAFRAKASEQLVSNRSNVGDIDRQKREPDRPTGVADQDPAVDKFPFQAGGDLLRAGYLAHQRINALAHPRSLPGRCVKLRRPSASTVPLRLAVAAYLARFTGSSRDHAHSDLRCFLAWCAERGLDPLAARRAHLELYIRWMQEVRRFKPSTVSRRFPVTAGFYRTAVIDGGLKYSPAEPFAARPYRLPHAVRRLCKAAVAGPHRLRSKVCAASHEPGH